LAYLLLSLLSYPPFNLGALAYLSCLPLFWLVTSGVSAVYYFWLLLVFNLLYFVWLAHTNIPGWLLISFVFAAGSLPGFWTARYFLRKNWLFLFSVALVFFEALRLCSDYALPFQIIGYTQWNIYAARQLAALGGIWLVSWFVYAVNLIFYDLFKRRRLRWGWALALLLLVAAANYIPPVKYTKSIRVALIQTGLRLDNPAVTEELFWDAYTQACLQAAPYKPELYVWPEVAVGRSLREDRTAAQRLRVLLSRLDAGLILGNRATDSFSLRFNDNYNAVFYIDRGGAVRGAHYKQKLIPFMETANYHLPFLPYFIRNKIAAGVYRPGSDRNIFSIQPGLRVAPLICYEAADGAYVRGFMRQRPDFIVNVSSDGWSRSLAEHQLNLHFNVFRAVESRRHLLRVAEDGISAVISPRGEILAGLPAFASGNIIWDVPY
jgi:apolipoprotein N-acyltransferase